MKLNISPSPSGRGGFNSNLPFGNGQNAATSKWKKLDMMRKYCSVVARRFMVLCGNMTLYGTFSLLDKNVCQTILSARFFQTAHPEAGIGKILRWVKIKLCNIRFYLIKRPVTASHRVMYANERETPVSVIHL